MTISSSVSDWSPCWPAIRRTRQSTRSMCAAPPNSARAADEAFQGPQRLWHTSRKGPCRHRWHPEKHRAPDPVVDLARQVDVRVDRLLDRNHVVAPDAAIVAGHQHRPFGQRHKNGVVNLELHRDFEGAVAWVESRRFNVSLEVSKQGVVSDPSNRAALKLVGNPTWRTFLG